MIRRKEKAFSLIETLVALMIFSVVIVAVIEGLTVQVRSQQLAEDTTRAVMLAQNVLEELRYEGDYSVHEDEGEFDGSNDGFGWWYKIETTELDALAHVTVRVNWGVNDRHSHTIETYLAQ